MNLREAWRLSKVPYVELTYRSAVMTRGSARDRLGYSRNPTAAVKSVIRGALVSKAVFTAFIGIGTLFTYSRFAADRTPAALVSGVTFGLAISLAYLVLYSLQVLPSFSGAEPYVALSVLPLEERDLSLVTILSVVRTFDSIAMVAVAVQVGAVAYLTGSVAAAAAVLLLSCANCVFGVGISLWLSGVFQKNITRGGRGKAASATRFIFLMSWGLAAASLGFLFNLVSYAVPILDSAVSGALATSAVPIIFSVVHPFSAGVLVASIVFPAFARESSTLRLASLLSFAALPVYLGIAFLAGRRALRLAGGIAHGPTMTVVRQRTTEFLLRLRRPVPAYVVKDLRIASKNPSTAFVFALPVLETLVIGLTLTQGVSLRAYSVITATALGCFFTLISASVLLNTEGTGLDYTLSLPINAAVIVLAKSAIATAAYAPVPVAIAAIVALGRPDALWLGLIPLVEAVAMSAATSAELTFFIQSYRKGGVRSTSKGVETRGMSLMSPGDLARLIAALGVAGFLALAPLGAYAGAFALGRDHASSLAAMTAVALSELGAVQLYVRRM